MRTALVWMALWGVGLLACGSDRPRAVGVPGGGAPGTKDAAAGGSTGASDGGEVGGASDTASPDGAADGSDVAIPDAAVAADAATPDGPAMPAGPRPVKPSPGCGKGNRTEGIQYIVSGGIRTLFTVRLPAGYDPDRPSPLGLAFPTYPYPQCTVHCWGFTDIDAVTLFPRTWKLSWDETDDATQVNFVYVEDMIAYVKNEYCVDENRMFVAGSGLGARFAQKLACKYGDGLWQVSAISAPAPHLDPTCQGKPAALVIQSVEQNGADVGQAVVENLAARNGCSATPPPGLASARDAMLAAYQANRPEARCLDWAGCARPVRLCLVSNKVNTPGQTTQGYRGWPMSGGGLIGEFLDRLD